MLRTHPIQRLSRHLACVLEKLTFPEDVIVTVDVNAISFCEDGRV